LTLASGRLCFCVDVAGQSDVDHVRERGLEPASRRFGDLRVSAAVLVKGYLPQFPLFSGVVRRRFVLTMATRIGLP